MKLITENNSGITVSYIQCGCAMKDGQCKFYFLYFDKADTENLSGNSITSQLMDSTKNIQFMPPGAITKLKCEFNTSHSVISLHRIALDCLVSFLCCHECPWEWRLKIIFNKYGSITKSWLLLYNTECRCWWVLIDLDANPGYVEYTIYEISDLLSTGF